MLPRVFLVLLSLLALGVSAQPNSSPAPAYDDYRKVTPTMLVIIVVLIAALFFMGFFSIYIRHFSGWQLENPRLQGGTIFLGRGSRAMRGLEPSVVETFPTLQYSEAKLHRIGKGGIECAVCLNEFEENEILRLIPKCDHVFHQACIDPWLAAHVTCPVCRAHLDHQTEEPPAAQQAIEVEPEQTNQTEPAVEPTLGARAARSGRRALGWFPRSHTTGHSLVPPGENTERFTLRLPDDVRQRIMTRQLERSVSLVALPRERSTRQGLRGNEGSRGKPPRPPSKLGGPAAKSDHWALPRNASFLSRASSFLTRGSSRSQKQGEGSSSHSAKREAAEPDRPPV